MRKLCEILLPMLLCLAPLTASAQSFRVQCPNSTVTHPAATNNSEPRTPVRRHSRSALMDFWCRLRM